MLSDDPKPWLNPDTGQRRAYSIWEGYVYAPRPGFDPPAGVPDPYTALDFDVRLSWLNDQRKDRT